ncbi:putative Pyridoxal phosphate (PLP)-dependent transferases superfamily protein [Hibiscus syriacus]|uniref:Pyridoxal phosphate (PLP)-dependent transferases superfamily protein n=1 Tax=Hibiscus syriacus TaxID=106335 RepID=A0A6A2X4S4_HIBSY|nr:putative Pyridoxal phosphate (PLP)-dependent transferases superfamily protein [Hibiscus syriacus]
MNVSSIGESNRLGLHDSYRPLPALYLGFLSIWFFSACSWTFNTFKNRHFQINNLQWTLASVPLIKALQLMLSFLFWYSCVYLELCSLWMSFGVYITGVLFQTVSFVSFLLISHGYCITCERLSVTERRTTAALGCVFYLTLVGYRASVPYFTVLLLLNYMISFYVIFRHISQNLLVLREQLTFMGDEDVQPMRDAVYMKYRMLKYIQGAMQIVAMAEAMLYINIDDSLENYWFRLLVREWVQFCIFMFIGWTFRSQEPTPRFSVMPTLKSKVDLAVPPIYRVEMDAMTFQEFQRHEWHIGVPTSVQDERSRDSVLVIIQHPNTYRPTKLLSSRKQTV